jgi:hypothetical protein
MPKDERAGGPKGSALGLSPQNPSLFSPLDGRTKRRRRRRRRRRKRKRKRKRTTTA